MSEKRRDRLGRLLRIGEQQRSDGRYMFTWIDTATGERRFVYSWKLEMRDRQPAGTKYDLSLREKEKEIEKYQRSGMDYKAGKLSVLELVKKYTSQKRNVRGTTIRGYTTTIKFLEKDAFGKRIISEIKTSEAKEWLISLQSEQGKSYSAIHNYRGVIRPAFAMAVEDDFLMKNPFDFPLGDVLIDDSIKRDSITPKQERAFLGFLENDETYQYLYDIAVILFETGLRVSELSGLILKDVDMAEKSLHVSRQLQYVSGKTYIEDETKTEAGMRILPLSEKALGSFEKVLKRKRPNIEPMFDGVTGFIFLDHNDKPMVSYKIEKAFQRAREKYNSIYKEELPVITPHVCRHTYCSRMARTGISPKTLQYLMGHADIDTTMNVYTHVHADEAKADVEKARREEALKAKEEVENKGM